MESALNGSFCHRYVEGQLVVPKVVLSSPISAYENTREVETIEQLEEIISDPDEMRMQVRDSTLQSSK